jgi:gamma-glutamyltranspeptidase/glutathione hydrolase
MMVSFIQSNYMGFGSGVVVPGTGISLQNRGHGFTTEAGHANQVGPRKRPSHTIIPAFAMHADGTPQMAFGVMGGPCRARAICRWPCACCATARTRRLRPMHRAGA